MSNHLYNCKKWKIPVLLIRKLHCLGRKSLYLRYQTKAADLLDLPLCYWFLIYFIGVFIINIYIFKFIKIILEINFFFNTESDNELNFPFSRYFFRFSWNVMYLLFVRASTKRSSSKTINALISIWQKSKTRYSNQNT